MKKLVVFNGSTRLWVSDYLHHASGMADGLI